MKKYVSGQDLMSQAMQEKIDRIIEQQDERLRRKLLPGQRGLSQWGL